MLPSIACIAARLTLDLSANDPIGSEHSKRLAIASVLIAPTFDRSSPPSAGHSVARKAVPPAAPPPYRFDAALRSSSRPRPTLSRFARSVALQSSSPPLHPLLPPPPSPPTHLSPPPTPRPGHV